ncbi:MAG: CvpA family protein [Clostridia bacterium]|nr:CvpA family protein [Clostridia bacterium]
MHFIIDLILIGIIAIIALVSAKKGFVRTVVEVVGFIAAVLIAFTVSKPLADVTYEKMVEPAIVNSVSDSAEQSTINTVDTVWESLPQFVTDNAANFGISKEVLEESISKGAENNAQTILTDISRNVIKPLVTNILKTVYAVLLIILLSFIVKLLAKLLNKVFSFSVVGKLNKTLGGILGILKGIAIALIICEAVLLIVSFTENGIWILNNANIEKTILFKFLTNVF